jgi:ubiquinone/menaquinone biosynthesis C-methylase UbiE
MFANNCEQYSVEALKGIGIKKGNTVLDCCCGNGNYTRAASKIVGEKGFVYAVDYDKEKLQNLQKEFKLNPNLFQNIKVMQEDVEQKISLPNNSVDVVLLYDIFWYFRPDTSNLTNLLHEILRIVKYEGLVSVFPTHINTNELLSFQKEMKDIGFHLVNQLRKRLVHEKNIEWGTLLNFQR